MQNNNDQESSIKPIYSQKQEALTFLNNFHLSFNNYSKSYQNITTDMFNSIKQQTQLIQHQYSEIINLFKGYRISSNLEHKLEQNQDETKQSSKQINTDQIKMKDEVESGISIFFEELKSFTENINKIQQKAQKDIADCLFQEAIKKMEMQIKYAEEDVKKYITKLEKNNQAVDKSLVAFFKLYESSIKNDNSDKRCGFDTIDGLFNYMNKIQNLIPNLNNYGQSTLSYRNVAIELRNTYKKSVKQAIIDFTSSIENLFGAGNTIFSKSVDHFSALDFTETKEDNLEISHLIGKKDELQNIIGDKALISSNIIEAIQHFKYPDLKELLEKFSIKYFEFSDIPDGLTDSLLLITLDFFFVVYKKKNNEYEKKLSIAIENVKLNMSEDEEFIKCTYKSRRIILKFKKSFDIYIKKEYIDGILSAYKSSIKAVMDMKTSSKDSRKQIDKLVSEEIINNNGKNTNNSGSKIHEDELLNSNFSENQQRDDNKEKLSTKSQPATAQLDVETSNIIIDHYTKMKEEFSNE